MNHTLYSPKQLSKVLADRNIRAVSMASGTSYTMAIKMRKGLPVPSDQLELMTRYVDKHGARK